MAGRRCRLVGTADCALGTDPDAKPDGLNCQPCDFYIPPPTGTETLDRFPQFKSRIVSAYLQVNHLVKRWAGEVSKTEVQLPIDDAIVKHLQRAEAALTEAEYWATRRPGLSDSDKAYVDNELRIQNVYVEMSREEAAQVACALEMVTEAGLDDHLEPEEHDRLVDVAQRIRKLDLTTHTPTKDDR